MKKLAFLSAGIIILSFALSAFMVYYMSSEAVSKDKQQEYLISEHIFDAIHEEFYRPIVISRSMSINSFLQDILMNEDKYSEAEATEKIAEYLHSIKQEMHYSTAFVASDATRRYYTENGIEKYLDPQTSPYDIWYPLFQESRKTYDLDTDRDQINDYRWTVFINYRILSPDGKFLGACGVGLVMTNLQFLFEEFESQYKVKINLIDQEGLVQIDTHAQNIENAYISEAILDNAGSEQFTYATRGLNCYRMTRYMRDLEWYLVVQDTNFGSENVMFCYIFVAITGILVLTAYFIIVSRFTKQYQNSVPEDHLEDSLTGLPTRDYLREAYGEEGVFNTTRYKSIAVFDVDNFKRTNENRNGGILLREIVNLADEYFAWKGMLLRWGDDDFVALLEMSAEDAEAKFKEFCEDAKRCFDVTISVGIAEINLSDTIKVNYYRAVQKCFAMKEKGGDGVCRI